MSKKVTSKEAQINVRILGKDNCSRTKKLIIKDFAEFFSETPEVEKQSGNSISIKIQRCIAKKELEEFVSENENYGGISVYSNGCFKMDYTCYDRAKNKVVAVAM